MKSLAPALFCLALLSTACNKSAQLDDVVPASQFERVINANPIAIGINAFTLNGVVYPVSAISKTFGLHQQIAFTSNMGAQLICSSKTIFPTADGTYMYLLDNNGIQPFHMQVSCVLNGNGTAYQMFCDDCGVATLKVVNGRFYLTIPEVKLESSRGSDDYLLVRASLSQTVISNQVPSAETPISN